MYICIKRLFRNLQSSTFVDDDTGEHTDVVGNEEQDRLTGSGSDGDAVDDGMEGRESERVRGLWLA